MNSETSRKKCINQWQYEVGKLVLTLNIRMLKLVFAFDILLTQEKVRFVSFQVRLYFVWYALRVGTFTSFVLYHDKKSPANTYLPKSLNDLSLITITMQLYHLVIACELPCQVTLHSFRAKLVTAWLTGNNNSDRAKRSNCLFKWNMTMTLINCCWTSMVMNESFHDFHHAMLPPGDKTTHQNFSLNLPNRQDPFV